MNICLYCLRQKNRKKRIKENNDDVIKKIQQMFQKLVRCQRKRKRIRRSYEKILGSIQDVNSSLTNQVEVTIGKVISEFTVLF